MLKILHARLQRYVNKENPGVQPGFRKGRTRDKIVNDHRKSKRIPENIYFCFINYDKAFDHVDHNKLWKILQEIS